ncbi:MAG: hypothetical protein U9Q69_05900 [Nanoarchaeota archaeon]|nr:hypothetical protein [Nanoarchaeota archaeon]
MKKIILILTILLSANLVIAGNNIYGFVDNIVKTNNANGYTILVGDDAPAADVRTTSEMVTSFHNKMSGELKYDLASQISSSTNMILLGNPCDNPKLNHYVKCSTWPYEEGEALIKVIGSNLIIAGTTPEDTRMAAHAIIDYKRNSELNADEIVIKGTMNSYKFTETKIARDEPIEMEEKEFVCGDGICMPEEMITCKEDCLEYMTCAGLCMAEGFIGGDCRNVNREIVCGPREIKTSEGNCGEEEVCCCIPEMVDPEEFQEELEKMIGKDLKSPPKKYNFLSRLMAAIMNLLRGLF